jgi:hypothetical protein
LLLLAWVALAFALANPNIAGLYHDDGVYLTCSKALATGQGYRIISLPEQPYQTKYPPLFSLLLAPIWWVSPEFPGNVRWFQGIVILSGVAFLSLSQQMMNRVFKFESRTSLLLLALLVLNPALLSASQWILSEIPYAAVSTGALVYYETKCRRGGPLPVLCLFLLAVLSSAGYLLKAHGIVLPMAIAICILFERKWRDLTIYLGSLTLFLVPWWLWASRVGKDVQYSPLTQYYVGYQSTLSSSHDFSHWAMIIGQNAKYVTNTLDHLLLALIPLLQTGSRVPLALLFFGLGVALTWRTLSHAVAVYMFLFLSLVLILPWHPSRHLIPIFPLFLATVTLMVLQAKTWITVRHPKLLKFLQHPLPQLVVWIPIAVIFISQSVQILLGLQRKHPSLLPNYDAFYSREASWKGFIETSDWIRQNTGSSEKVASPHDPLYFLYTGRQGIRYSFHNPESYFYPDFSRARPQVGDRKIIIDCLKVLNVTWLIREPILELTFAEGKAVNAVAESIVQQKYPKATLSFASSDGGHYVYRLEW